MEDILPRCRIAKRNLPQAAWLFYLPNTPYLITYPQWLPGE
jgi:hypothetical protein